MLSDADLDRLDALHGVIDVNDATDLIAEVRRLRESVAARDEELTRRQRLDDDLAPFQDIFANPSRRLTRADMCDVLETAAARQRRIDAALVVHAACDCLAEHRNAYGPMHEPCTECGTEWPCRTVRALTGDADDDAREGT